jgi:hypothetical protein
MKYRIAEDTELMHAKDAEALIVQPLITGYFSRIIASNCSALCGLCVVLPRRPLRLKEYLRTIL